MYKGCGIMEGPRKLKRRVRPRAEPEADLRTIHTINISAQKKKEKRMNSMGNERNFVQSTGFFKKKGDEFHRRSGEM